MVFVPREYQVKAVEGVVVYAAEHPTGRALVVVPPRGGKTLIGALLVLEMAVRHSLRALWLVHREELLDEAVRHLVEVGVPPGLIGVIKAGRVSNPTAKVQVANEGTLVRRAVPMAHLVITDESHRDTAAQRRRLRALFPRAFLIGLTASPYPPPARDLGEDYDILMAVVQPSELIADGFLSSPTIYAPVREEVPDLRGLRTANGDWRDVDLEPLLLRRSLLDDQVREWARLAEGRSTLAFPVTIAHSKALAERFQAAGVAAKHLDGGMAPTERRAIVEGLRTGTVPVVCNVAVLSEGTNIPRVKCVLGVRPTLSLVLFLQSSMRCATPWHEVAPRVLDVVGNVYQHGYPHADRQWSLKREESGKLVGGGAAVLKRCGCGAVMLGGVLVCTACHAPFPVHAPSVPVAPLHLDVVTPGKTKLAEERKRLLAFATNSKFTSPAAWVERVLATKYGASCAEL